MSRGVPVRDVRSHFESKLVVGHEGGHWSLSTKLSPEGYSVISVGSGRIDYGHRVSYRLSGREIPDGYHVDHLCRVRWCVNPDHLEAVTHAENLRRAYRVCGSGEHDMTDPANYYQRVNGRRMCKPCNDRRNARRKESK